MAPLSNVRSMKPTAQSGSLCSQTRKTGWLSVPWNPTGTRNSKNWKKQNRITPYNDPKNPGFLPKKKNRISGISHKRSRRSGMHQHLRQKKRSVSFASYSTISPSWQKNDVLIFQSASGSAAENAKNFP